jgi:YHS domain-containing protein
MARIVMKVLCGAAATAALYWAEFGAVDFANRNAFGATGAVVAATAPAKGAASVTSPATGTAPSRNSRSEVVDIGNTKCIVSADDVGTTTVEYQGKLYHLCCADCLADFKKDPAKYVKALEADPAKYGVKK